MSDDESVIEEAFEAQEKIKGPFTPPKESGMPKKAISQYGSTWLLQNGILTKTIINSIIISLYSISRYVKEVEMTIDQENKKVLVAIWISKWGLLFRKLNPILDGSRMILKDYLKNMEFSFEIEWGNYKFYKDVQK